MSITNVITRITVDMAGDVKRFAVKAKQYDRATRVIVVSLLWDEVPYVLDSADTVRCNVHKPDGTIAIVEGDNIAVSGNTVTITLPGTALTAAGRAWADIEIETQDESQQVSCQCFEIDIAKSPVDDDSIISTNEFSAMKLATKAANEAAAAATAEIEATAAAGTAASQAAAAAQAATDAANQAAAAATASIQIDATLTDNSKAAPAGLVGQIKEDLSATLYTHTNADISSAEVKSGLISSTSGNWVYNANYKSYFIPIPKNAKSISVTANDANVTVLAILINKALVSYTNPYYADGCSRETVDVGSTREFSVPSNGNWICILKSTTSGSTVTDFTPVSVDFTLVEIDTRNLSNITHEPITSQGVLNVVRRCRQLTDIKWTPAVDIPRICQLRGYSSVNPQYYEDVFKAGIEYKGIPYGQATKNTGKWGKDSVIGFKVGWGVGLDTFISAVQSPESVIAKESEYMATTGKHLASFYATICTALCGYAYNLPTYYTTDTIGGADGMERLDIVRNLNNNGYRFSIGDMLLSGAHGSVITDIKRDSDGMPLAIEISEATTIGNDDWNVEGSQYGGICRRLFWSYDEFVGKWGSYGVYRYSMIDNVEYTPSPYVDTGNEGDTLRVFEFPVLPYMGENFQYMTGAIPTTKILTPAYRANSLNKLRVLKDGQAWNVDGTTSYYDVSGAFVEVGFADAGTYTAYLCQVVDGAETMTTRPCHWTVI